MDIVLNGETLELPANSSLQDLIDQQNLAQRRLAVEVNMEIIPRSLYTSHRLQSGDKIEIVHAIGGG